MSVVTNADNDFHETKCAGKCQKCDVKLYNYPFLEWREQGAPILLCAPCCKIIAKGLTADLIHLTAIQDLHDIGYRWNTLERSSVR